MILRELCIYSEMERVGSIGSRVLFVGGDGVWAEDESSGGRNRVQSKEIDGRRSLEQCSRMIVVRSSLICRKVDGIGRQLGPFRKDRLVQTMEEDSAS